MQINTENIKVLVVDDHPVVAEGTVSLLRKYQHISVVGTAKSGAECLSIIKSIKPQVVLLDINLPDISGVKLIEKIMKFKLNIKIIMFTGHNPEEFIKDSLIKGACGFLLKNCSKNELIKAINTVVKGEVFFSQSLNGFFSSFITSQEKVNIDNDSKRILNIMTSREKEIMNLISKGLQNKEIATKLGIKTRTVDFHISNILSKLGVNSRLEAVLIWLKI